MYKKFVQGFVFGLGAGLAFLLVLFVGMQYIITTTSPDSQNAAVFMHPKTADVIKPTDARGRNFNFFAHADDPMKIPVGGGLLSMSTIPTPGNEKRPRTYQLWLTHSGFWQIRTTEDKVETEKLPYPQDASEATVGNLIVKTAGAYGNQGTMTVSKPEIENMMAGGTPHDQDSLNGRLSITDGGVVFVLPNPYSK